MQQQSLRKAAEEAGAEVIHDAQDYIAAESAAMRNKQAKGNSVEQLTTQGELCCICCLAVMPPCQALLCLMSYPSSPTARVYGRMVLPVCCGIWL